VELIENEAPAPGVLPEPEPRYSTATLPSQKTEHGQGIVRIIAAILAGIILIVLIVLLARWIYHSAHHAVTPAPPSTSLKTPAVSPDNNTSGAQPSSGTPPTASPNNPTSAPAAPQITNTGPGDVVAIFAGAALAAAGLHYIISVRRFSRGQS
jgi:hypothetical protein